MIRIIFGHLRKKVYLCANKRKKSIGKDKYIEEQNTGFFIDSF